MKAQKLSPWHVVHCTGVSVWARRMLLKPAGSQKLSPFVLKQASGVQLLGTWLLFAPHEAQSLSPLCDPGTATSTCHLMLQPDQTAGHNRCGQPQGLPHQPLLDPGRLQHSACRTAPQHCRVAVLGIARLAQKPWCEQVSTHLRTRLQAVIASWHRYVCGCAA